MRDAIESMGGSMSFTGERGVAVYRATVLASGLRLYARTGMRPNAAYTPKAMMATASAILGGRKFKARDYMGAAEALTVYARELADSIHAENRAQ